MAQDVMLEDWLRRAIAATGAGPVDEDLVGQEGIELLLDLARDAAHGVARPAAPLATFAAGLALGLALDRGRADLAVLRAAAEAISSAAGDWSQEL